MSSIQEDDSACSIPVMFMCRLTLARQVTSWFFHMDPIGFKWCYLQRGSVHDRPFSFILIHYHYQKSEANVLKKCFLIPEFLPFWTSRTSTSPPKPITGPRYYRRPLRKRRCGEHRRAQVRAMDGYGQHGSETFRMSGPWHWPRHWVQDGLSLKLPTKHFDLWCYFVCRFWICFASKPGTFIHRWGINSCHHVLTRYLSLAEVLAEHGRSWKNHGKIMNPCQESGHKSRLTDFAV